MIPSCIELGLIVCSYLDDAEMGARRSRELAKKVTDLAATLESESNF